MGQCVGKDMRDDVAMRRSRRDCPLILISVFLRTVYALKLYI